MDDLTLDVLLIVLGQAAVCGALYGAIRADIKGIHRDLDRHSQDIKLYENRALDLYDRLNTRITEAHTRLDSITGKSRS